jgi:hypothetical protein
MQLRISGKDLGAMALPGFCPRCFWVKRHCTLPFQIFPGIFSSLDSYGKRLTWSYYAKHSALPPWFAGIAGAPVKAPGLQKFFLVDAETDVKLTGVPDEMVQNDAGYIIVDYKTAKYTSGQDALLPMYAVQLNAYALIAESIGMGPVTGLWLIYHEPVTEVVDVDGNCDGEKFLLRFANSRHSIPCDSALIGPLMRRAREIYDLERPPVGTDGCKDCMAMQGIVERLG